MLRRFPAFALLAAIALAASVASAGDPLTRLSRALHSGPAYYPPTQGRFAHRPPGDQPFYAENVTAYPWLNNGQAVPTYNWGYFGARYRPLVSAQHSYFDDYQQWSYRPGD